MWTIIFNNSLDENHTWPYKDVMHNFNIFICFGIILRNTTSKNKVVILTFYKAIHFDYHLIWNNAVQDYFLCTLWVQGYV